MFFTQWFAPRWRQRTLALSFVLIGACSSAGSWNYASRATTPATAATAGPVGGRIAVLPFADRRSSRNQGRVLLALIPLVPYAGMTYERIEGGSHFLTHSAYQVRPAEDLAKALVSELRSLRRFDEAFFTEREKEPEVDFIVRGTVKEFKYRGKLFTYCLGPYATPLWLLGLPTGKVTNRIEVSVELVDAHTGTVLWKSEPAPSEWSEVTGFYYNWGEEFAGFPELYRKHAEQWARELAQAAERARASASVTSAARNN